MEILFWVVLGINAVTLIIYIWKWWFTNSCVSFLVYPSVYQWLAKVNISENLRHIVMILFCIIFLPFVVSWYCFLIVTTLFVAPYLFIIYTRDR
jgi:hypothetical protein